MGGTVGQIKELRLASGEIGMRKAYWFIVAVVAVTMFAGAGGWTMLSSPAGAINARSGSIQIDPLQAMRNAKNLPASHYNDYSVVFE